MRDREVAHPLPPDRRRPPRPRVGRHDPEPPRRRAALVRVTLQCRARRAHHRRDARPRPATPDRSPVGLRGPHATTIDVRESLTDCLLNTDGPDRWPWAVKAGDRGSVRVPDARGGASHTGRSGGSRVWAGHARTLTVPQGSRSDTADGRMRAQVAACGRVSSSSGRARGRAAVGRRHGGAGHHGCADAPGRAVGGGTHEFRVFTRDELDDVIVGHNSTNFDRSGSSPTATSSSRSTGSSRWKPRGRSAGSRRATWRSSARRSSSRPSSSTPARPRRSCSATTASTSSCSPPSDHCARVPCARSPTLQRRRPRRRRDRLGPPTGRSHRAATGVVLRVPARRPLGKPRDPPTNAGCSTPPSRSSTTPTDRSSSTSPTSSRTRPTCRSPARSRPATTPTAIPRSTRHGARAGLATHLQRQRRDPGRTGRRDRTDIPDAIMLFGPSPTTAPLEVGRVARART